ncbi:MAG: diguanylate cyclase [Chloroflexi bacterium]|nr:diguanylate cyclase [Chloroflexota bacterium]
MSPRIVSSLCGVALLALFVGLAAFAVRQQYDDRSFDRQVQRDGELIQAYADLQAASLKAEAAAYRLIAGADPANAIADYHAATDDADRSARAVAQRGSFGDLRFAADLAKFATPFSSTSTEYFDKLAQVLGETGAAGASVVSSADLSQLARLQALMDQSLAEMLDAMDSGQFRLPADVKLPPRTSGPGGAQNPFPAIIDAQARQVRERLTAAEEAQRKRQDATFRESLALYGAGSVLIVLLLAATISFARRETRSMAQIEDLRRAVNTDSLTGLGNRRWYEEQSRALVARAARLGERLVLVMMDLDEFKEVNDTWGHDKGDAVLRRFAEIMHGAGDPDCCLFRVGGDEFAMLLRRASDGEAYELTERIRRTAEVQLGNGVTVSAGIAALDATVGADELLLLQRADAALYEAKLRGRNLVITYEYDGHAAPLFPAVKLQAVRQLLLEGDIDAYFQPIWNLESQSILGYEALARPHARYELAGPQQAFDIAEHFGRAADLDRICRQRTLEAAGRLPDDALLFINLSPYTLTHHSFSALGLLQELRHAHLPPSRVVFEITERSRVAAETIAAAAAELQGYGCRVALDDSWVW